MKKYLLLLCLWIAFSAQAQTENTLQKLQSVYATQVDWANAGELSYDTLARLIVVKNFKIPVSTDTHLKFDRKKGNKVIFAMQNNTAVTDVTDPAFRRAYFEIPFKTKDGVVSFITYFNKLKEEE